MGIKDVTYIVDLAVSAVRSLRRLGDESLIRGQLVSCLNSACPHRHVSAVATTSNGKVVVDVRERKWPELKPYITNEYSDTSAARAVT